MMRLITKCSRCASSVSFSSSSPLRIDSSPSLARLAISSSCFSCARLWLSPLIASCSDCFSDSSTSTSSACAFCIVSTSPTCAFCIASTSRACSARSAVSSFRCSASRCCICSCSACLSSSSDPCAASIFSRFSSDKVSRHWFQAAAKSRCRMRRSTCSERARFACSSCFLVASSSAAVLAAASFSCCSILFTRRRTFTCWRQAPNISSPALLRIRFNKSCTSCRAIFPSSSA
mmetsp:Transcript_2220/g.8055  ORF Transcript_2220/g.8055 Transcript_2220/m.8055 type:complete len:233 (-) Transcript_2220:508-1206(-)